MKTILREAGLCTVCEEARCPNIVECFERRTATFLILGDICTRNCRFCAVKSGTPTASSSDFANEVEAVVTAVEKLDLRHVVVTSVTRDDLSDGGAGVFAEVARQVKARFAEVTVELLVPDFGGSFAALASVLEAGPDVLNHNLETVPRLYPQVRPQASYQRSLELLRQAKSAFPSISTKTGIMLGLGEREEEVIGLMRDAAEVQVDVVTAGQYLQPSRGHLPVREYVTPEKFAWYQREGESLGIQRVFAAPVVRSSYHAGYGLS